AGPSLKIDRRAGEPAAGRGARPTRQDNTTQHKGSGCGGWDIGITMKRAAALTLLFAAPMVTQRRTVTDEEVEQVHLSTLLIDTHNDVPMMVLDQDFDIGSRAGTWHTDIARMKQGGIGAQFFSAYVGGEFVEGNHSANRALQMIDAIKHGIAERYPNDF